MLSLMSCPGRSVNQSPTSCRDLLPLLPNSIADLLAFIGPYSVIIIKSGNKLNRRFIENLVEITIIEKQTVKLRERK